MVYYGDGIPRSKALSVQKRLAILLSYKLKREYSELCGFVKPKMSLAIVRSTSLLLCRTWYKEAPICQQQDLVDRAVMALLTPWRG